MNVVELPEGSAEDQYSRACLATLLKVYEPLHARLALDPEDGPATAAALRGSCHMLDLPVPTWLHEWAPIEIAEWDTFHKMATPEPQDCDACRAGTSDDCTCDNCANEAGACLCASCKDKHEQEDMRRWRTKAIKALKSGKSPTVRFMSDVLDDATSVCIEEALSKASTTDDVWSVFKTFDSSLGLVPYNLEGSTPQPKKAHKSSEWPCNSCSQYGGSESPGCLCDACRGGHGKCQCEEGWSAKLSQEHTTKAADADGAGRWVTLKHPSGKGELVAHVYIENNIITKGPAGLLHADIRHLPEPKEHHPVGHEPEGAKDHPEYAEAEAPATPETAPEPAVEAPPKKKEQPGFKLQQQPQQLGLFDAPTEAPEAAKPKPKAEAGPAKKPKQLGLFDAPEEAPPTEATPQTPAVKTETEANTAYHQVMGDLAAKQPKPLTENEQVIEELRERVKNGDLPAKAFAHYRDQITMGEMTPNTLRVRMDVDAKEFAKDKQEDPHANLDAALQAGHINGKTRAIYAKKLAAGEIEGHEVNQRLRAHKELAEASAVNPQLTAQDPSGMFMARYYGMHLREGGLSAHKVRELALSYKTDAPPPMVKKDPKEAFLERLKGYKPGTTIDDDDAAKLAERAEDGEDPATLEQDLDAAHQHHYEDTNFDADKNLEAANGQMGGLITVPGDAYAVYKKQRADGKISTYDLNRKLRVHRELYAARHDPDMEGIYKTVIGGAGRYWHRLSRGLSAGTQSLEALREHMRDIKRLVQTTPQHMSQVDFVTARNAIVNDTVHMSAAQKLDHLQSIQNKHLNKADVHEIMNTLDNAMMLRAKFVGTKDDNYRDQVDDLYKKLLGQQMLPDEVGAKLAKIKTQAATGVDAKKKINIAYTDGHIYTDQKDDLLEQLDEGNITTDSIADRIQSLKTLNQEYYDSKLSYEDKNRLSSIAIADDQFDKAKFNARLDKMKSKYKVSSVIANEVASNTDPLYPHTEANKIASDLRYDALTPDEAKAAFEALDATYWNKIKNSVGGAIDSAFWGNHISQKEYAEHHNLLALNGNHLATSPHLGTKEAQKYYQALVSKITASEALDTAHATDVISRGTHTTIKKLLTDNLATPQDVHDTIKKWQSIVSFKQKLHALYDKGKLTENQYNDLYQNVHPSTLQDYAKQAAKLTGASVNSLLGIVKPKKTAGGPATTTQASATIEPHVVKASADYTSALKQKPNGGKYTSDQAKHEIAVNLGAHLKSVGVTVAQAKALDKAIENMTSDYHSNDDPHEKLASRMIQSWAGSSMDSQASSLMQHIVASHMFGLNNWDVSKGSKPPVDKISDNSWKNAQDLAYHPEHGKVIEHFLRGMYDQTQAKFKAEGLTHVVIHRGMRDGVTDPEVLKQWRAAVAAKTNSIGNVVGSPLVTFDTQPGEVTTNPLTSWTTSTNTGGSFSSGNSVNDYALSNLEHNGVGVMFGSTVPVEHIIGHFRTGFGCLGEDEYVCLGHDRPYVVAVGKESVDMMDAVNGVKTGGYQATNTPPKKAKKTTS